MLSSATNSNSTSSTDSHSFDRFLNYLSSATSTLDVCVYTITDDRIARVLEDLMHQGVRIRLITEDSTIDDTGKKDI